MPEFSALENLYKKGILEYNPKDYINGTTSNVIPNPNQDIFLPDNRFARVDGSYIREQLDKDIFESLDKPDSLNEFSPENNKETFWDKCKKILTSKVTAGIISASALILAGRYFLKHLHIIK